MLPTSIFPMPPAGFVRAPATHAGTTSSSSGRLPVAPSSATVPGQRVLALSVATTAAAAPPMHLVMRAKESAPERPMLKLVIGAGVALGYEFALGHYLEFIKIMKQTRPGSYVHLTKEIMHAKGVIGIWDGFFPWGAVQAVAKGSVFSWGHALTRQQLEPFVAEKRVSTDVAEVIAGGIGGGFQGFVLSPTLLLKTRVMTDPAFRGHMTPLETCKKSLSVGMKVVRNEGVSALMKGSVVFSLKRVVDWSTRFFFSVQSENMLYKREDPHAVLTTAQKMKASMLGGVFSSFLTLPIDVMVAQIQQASKAGAKVSIIDTFRQEFERGGMKQVAGFATTGFTVRLLHVCFTTMIMKTGTSAVYEMYSRSFE